MEQNNYALNQCLENRRIEMDRMSMFERTDIKTEICEYQISIDKISIKLLCCLHVEKKISILERWIRPCNHSRDQESNHRIRFQISVNEMIFPVD